VGSHDYLRLVGDLNIATGDKSALRINAMRTKADNNGSGSALDKYGVSAAFRWGIGDDDEFQVSLFHLDNNNGINYGIPFIRPYPTAPATERSLLPLDPDAYYGAASDYNDSSGSIATFSHLHRFAWDGELKTQVRVGKFERDQRSGALRICGPNPATLAPSASCPTVTTLPSLLDFGPNTVLTRGNHLKIQDMNNLHAQSDYSGKHQLFGLRHEVLAGMDYSREKKVVYAARNAAQGGVNITKPTTTIGTPDDGARVDESSRVLRVNNEYVADGVGAYLQDLIELTPTWKLVAGLRFDNLKGDYDQYAIPNNAPGPETATRYTMQVSEWSKRIGVLYQPSDLRSFHASYGTSFNTSGDAYSLGATNVDTPPEQSINMEIGAKIDSADKRLTTRMAIFRSTKLNERNTDPDLPVVALSGRRHVSGFELDAAGRLTHDWEIYGSYMWMPNAKVDKAAPCPATGQCLQGAPGERVGDRPALTPEHSGTIWTTYKVTPKLRVGAGLNFRGKQKPTRSEFHVPAYVTGDLMAEYHVSDDFTLKANLTNVTDKLYADQLYPAHYVPGAGRQLQMTASYRF
jgi:catecholate siderophore receptor